MPDDPSIADIQIARPPRQERSRASFERMMDAAERLWVERGSDEFTLNDVSRVGRVSIGSMYNRFAGKDELIHAVHARVMERLESDQIQLVAKARAKGGGRVGRIHALIGELGEFLAAHAPVLRPMMLRAAFDRVVQDRGRVAHDAMSEAICTELLMFRDRITHDEPEQAARAAVSIAYAAFARELGFGMTEHPYGGTEWGELKRNLGDMVARFLFCRADEGE